MCIRDRVYTVPERVTLLGCTSFANCGLTALIVPNAETRAMGYTFANCGLTLYGVPGGDLEEQYSGLNADRLTFAPLDQAPACDPYTAWAAAEELCGLGPVSYTHLDVYKRQGPHRPRRSR